MAQKEDADQQLRAIRQEAQRITAQAKVSPEEACRLAASISRRVDAVLQQLRPWYTDDSRMERHPGRAKEPSK